MPWRAFWTSRLLVWVAGIAGVLVSGADAYRDVAPEIAARACKKGTRPSGCASPSVLTW